MFNILDDDSAEEKNDNKRKSRNLSEKKRRDQFNLLVSELSVMTSLTTRKLDKSAVLKSTIDFLKNHNEVAVRLKVHEIPDDWKPTFLCNEEFTHLVLEALDSFIIVFASNGRILYTSEGVTALLGYLPVDLLLTTIYDLANEEQHSDLYNILRNPPAFVGCNDDSVPNDDKVQFNCHLKRGKLNFRDDVSYEEVQFNGFFRDFSNTHNISANSSERCGVSDEFESRTVFVGTCRIARPQLIREMSVQGCIKSEFSSRHSLEWKFLFLDHRAPPIIGYLPIEVLGTSGYDYYHFDDLEQVVTCHQALKLKGEGTSCYYRFLTKGQQWLWLQTRYYITYHQWTSKPEFIMCTHRVIKYVDVVQQMRRNNGQVEDIYDANDSADSVERQINTSASSMIITSPLSTKSVISKNYVDNESSSRIRHHKKYQADDTTNSDGLSSDHVYSSPQHSTMSRIRPYSQSVKMSPKRQSTFRSSASFIGDSSEYLNTFPRYFQSNVSNHQPNVFSTADVSNLEVPTHNDLQYELQRKQEELEQAIINQQNELRRVSEQLTLARYGASARSVSHPVSPINDPTVIPILEMQANIYHHHAHHTQQQHQQPSLDHQKSHCPSMHEAMQVDRDMLLHHQPQENYQTNIANIDSDHDMQHTSSSTSKSLNIDNEPISYMQLQPVNLMNTESHQLTQSHHQPQHYPQHYDHTFHRLRPVLHSSSDHSSKILSRSGDATQGTEISSYDLNNA